MDDKEIIVTDNTIDKYNESNRKIIVNTNTDMVTYGVAVQSIVNGFFDEDGKYTPQFGRANAVGVFFQFFVDEKSFNDYFADYADDIDLDFLLGNEECLRLYNCAMVEDNRYRLNFANAYKDAMDIIKVRTSTFAGVAGQFRNIIINAINEFSSIVTEENIEKLSKISDEVTNGSLNADSIVAAFGKALDK